MLGIYESNIMKQVEMIYQKFLIKIQSVNKNLLRS